MGTLWPVLRRNLVHPDPSVLPSLLVAVRQMLLLHTVCQAMIWYVLCQLETESATVGRT